MAKVNWLSEPQDHDYPAAESYLRLVASPHQIDAVVASLRVAPTITQKAKDILRAARLDLLPETNAHVADDLTKIEANQPLSPILLVRGRSGHNVPLQIADGYHRVCASYLTDENTDIPCRIADLPA